MTHDEATQRALPAEKSARHGTVLGRWRLASYLAAAAAIGACGSTGDSTDAGNAHPLGSLSPSTGADASDNAGDDATGSSPPSNPVPADGDAASPEGAATGEGGSAADSGLQALDASVRPPPFVATGAPITAADGAWTWVGFPDSFCRDGSTAGIAVSLESASKKVMIYIEGGGACFDSITCLANPANTSGQQAAKTAGVFDRTNAANPVKDWNFVYVPYCTGDIGAGANPNGTVSGVTGTQMFVGRPNLEAFLNRVVPTFPDATNVLLTGVSAGGFGAATNVPLVQSAFPAVKINLIDDSGPPMSSQYLPSCLQKEWSTTWGFENSFLKDCGAACPNPDDYVLDYAKFIGRNYSDRMAGLLESDTDGVISAFYGYGNNNCTGSLLTPIAGATYTAALVDFRSQIMGVDPNFGTYYPDSSQHTWLGDSSLYSETQGGTTLISWVSNIANDVSVSNVGP
jgi:hypothetical protein